MKLNIFAGKHVLYKHNGQWTTGILDYSDTNSLTESGLFLQLKSTDTEPIKVEINDIFLDSHAVEDWMKQYNLMTKEEYIDFIKSDDFDSSLEQAWVSDGEYYYYPVNKYNANWLMKQPFQYIVRG